MGELLENDPHNACVGWTVYARRDRVGLPTRTGALATQRRVATGETLALVGRVLREEEGALHAQADALGADGKLVARLEREYDFPNRDAFAARMGYVALPAVVADVLPE